MDSKLVSITIASLWLTFDTFWLDTFLRKKSYKKKHEELQINRDYKNTEKSEK